MSNLLTKQERLRARVWSIREDSGWFVSRLTTPVHVGAFLMRRCSAVQERLTTMVCPASPRPFESVQFNPARSFLIRAYDALERDDLIAAGCLLRQAAIEQLKAMCRWYGCEPPKRAKYPRPRDYLKALKRAKRLDCSAEWFDEILDAGNAAAHCRRVQRATIIGGISLLHIVVDDRPCGTPTDRPTQKMTKPVNPYDQDDDDDDDSGDEWKQGGAV